MFSRRTMAVAVIALAGLSHGEVLRTVADLSETLRNGEDADFDMTVTVAAPALCDGSTVELPIADETGASLVRCSLPRDRAIPSPGETVALSGRTDCASLRGPRFRLAWRRVAASTNAPAPHTRSLRDLHDGKADERYVRITGTVRDVLPSETNPNWIFLVLFADNTLLPVGIPLNDTPRRAYETLLRKDISIDGFCCPQDGSLRIYQGRIFHAYGFPHLAVLPDCGTDPFVHAVPLRQLRFRAPAEIARVGLARATGRLVARWGDGRALLKTPDGDFVTLAFTDREPPATDACVETVGFPMSDLFHITLQHALWREIPPLAVPTDPVTDMPIRRLVSEMTRQPRTTISLHGRPLRFTATVRSLPDDILNPDTIVVEDGDCSISLDVSSSRTALGRLAPGCRIEATAICLIRTEYWSPSLAFPQAHGFSAVLTKDADLRVLARPPWWTTGRITVAFGLVLALLLALVIREKVKRVRANLKAGERTRLAIELHDTLAQSLTGVALELKAAENAGVCVRDPSAAHLRLASGILASCRRELRNCLWDLRNRALEMSDLAEAIRLTLRPVADEGALRVRVASVRPHIPDEVRHALLRILRELAANALRHGAATRVRFAGSVTNREILFRVSDNGRGFDTGTAPGVPQGHFGLQGVRERLDQLHGTLDIRSSPGHGAVLTIGIPLRDQHPHR